MKTESCIQCGYCCTVAPCVYGLVSTERLFSKECALLSKPNEFGQRFCTIHEKIKNDIMFGGGCSSSLFNTEREKVLKLKGEFYGTKTKSH